MSPKTIFFSSIIKFFYTLHSNESEICSNNVLPNFRR
eukprot:UN20071